MIRLFSGLGEAEAYMSKGENWEKKMWRETFNTILVLIYKEVV